LTMCADSGPTDFMETGLIIEKQNTVDSG